MATHQVETIGTNAPIPLVTEVETGSDYEPGSFYEPPLLTPGEQQLLEALTMNEEFEAALHQSFELSMQQEIATCVDPLDIELITTTASIIEWEWFGKPGDPLPEGVVIGWHNDSPVPMDPFACKNFYRVRDHLLDDPLHDIELAIATEIEGMHLAVEEACKKIVRESDLYKFLHVLASDTPEVVDLPLSLASRMIRETQEEDEVRKKYDIPQSESISLHHNANRQLQQRLYRLDEETERRKNQRQADPRQRIMQFMVDLSNMPTGEETPEDLEDQDFVDYFYFDNDDARDDQFFAMYVDGEEVWLGGDGLYELSQAAANFVSPQKLIERYADTDMIMSFLIPKLFDKAEASKSALELLEESIDRLYFDDVAYDKKINMELLLYLRRVQADIVRMPSDLGLRPSWVKNTVKPSVEVHSEELLRDEQSRVAGRAEGDIRGATNHLIITANSKENYPESTEDYDLKISFDEYDINFWLCDDSFNTHHGVPVVPGYELMAHNSTDFYFHRAEIDPYRGSAEVLIDSHNRQAVIDRCNDIGLTWLADNLSVIDQLSLADLVEVISRSSDYTFDSSYDIRRYNRNNNGFTDEDFSSLVDSRGRLQVQCTGAATFLCGLLETALPGCSTAIIGGKVIGADGIITEAEHAQVQVVYKGEQYIVDSTPSLPSKNSWDSGLPGGISDSAYRQQSHQQRQNSSINGRNENKSHKKQVEKDVEPEVTSSTSTHLQAEEAIRVDNVAGRAKLMLKAHFSIPSASDDRLYERVVKLKEGADPIRKVIKLVLLTEKENYTQVLDEVDTVAAYIENLQSASHRTIRKIGIPPYDDTFLSSLAGIIKDIKTKALSQA